MSEEKKEGLSRAEFLGRCGRGFFGLAVGGALSGLGLGRAQAESTPAKDAKDASEKPLPFEFVAAGVFEPDLTKPLGIALDPRDHLYVAGAEGVKIFDPAGRAVRLIATGGPACCVAIGPDGVIYVAQRAHIEKFTLEGQRLPWGGENKDPNTSRHATFGTRPLSTAAGEEQDSGRLRYITGLAVSENCVYATDAGLRRVSRFALDGDFIDDIQNMSVPAGNPACCATDCKTENLTEGFLIPSGYFDCAVDAKGVLYVGHTGRHRVERYDGNNQMIGCWGRYGNKREDFCGCCNPTNIALFADGRVATTEKGVPRLKVYNAKGELLAFLGPESFPGNTAGMDLAVDSRNRVAVLEPVMGKIRIYELKKVGS